MQDLTMIIKTFERPYCLKRALKSIYKYYPDAKVIVADDSKDSNEKIITKYFSDKDVEYFRLPQDCGVSYGRNRLVEKVKTKYFLLLDDDFVIDKKTELEESFCIMKERKLDILGGYVRNYKTVNNYFDRFLVFFETLFKYEIPSNYIGTIEQKGNELYFDYKIHEFPEYQESDMVINFFIAKTKTILEKNMWDEDLKIQEHSAFFYTAKKAGLKIAFTNKLSVRHMPVRLKRYSNFRTRNYVQVFMKKYGIKKIITTYDDASRNHITLLEEDIKNEN